MNVLTDLAIIIKILSCLVSVMALCLCCSIFALPLGERPIPSASDYKKSSFFGFYRGHFVLRILDDTAVIPDTRNSLWLTLFVVQQSFRHLLYSRFPLMMGQMEVGNRIQRYYHDLPDCNPQRVAFDHPVLKGLLSLSTGCIEDKYPVWWFYPAPATSYKALLHDFNAEPIREIFDHLHLNERKFLALIPSVTKDKNYLTLYTCDRQEECLVMDIAADFGLASERDWLLHLLTYEQKVKQKHWLDPRKYRNSLSQKEVLTALDDRILGYIADGLMCHSFYQSQSKENQDYLCRNGAKLEQLDDHRWRFLPAESERRTGTRPWLHNSQRLRILPFHSCQASPQKNHFHCPNYLLWGEALQKRSLIRRKQSPILRWKFDTEVVDFEERYFQYDRADCEEGYDELNWAEALLSLSLVTSSHLAGLSLAGISAPYSEQSKQSLTPAGSGVIAIPQFAPPRTPLVSYVSGINYPSPAANHLPLTTPVVKKGSAGAGSFRAAAATPVRVYLPSPGAVGFLWVPGNDPNSNNGQPPPQPPMGGGTASVPFIPASLNHMLMVLSSMGLIYQGHPASPNIIQAMEPLLLPQIANGQSLFFRLIQRGGAADFSHLVQWLGLRTPITEVLQQINQRFQIANNIHLIVLSEVLDLDITVFIAGALGEHSFRYYKKGFPVQAGLLSDPGRDYLQSGLFLAWGPEGFVPLASASRIMPLMMLPAHEPLQVAFTPPRHIQLNVGAAEFVPEALAILETGGEGFAPAQLAPEITPQLSGQNDLIDLVALYRSDLPPTHTDDQVLNEIRSSMSDSKSIFHEKTIRKLAEAGMISFPAVELQEAFTMRFTKTMAGTLLKFWTDHPKLLIQLLGSEHKLIAGHNERIVSLHRNVLLHDLADVNFDDHFAYMLNIPLPKALFLAEIQQTMFSLLVEAINEVRESKGAKSVVIYGGLASRTHLVHSAFGGNYQAAISAGIHCVNDVDIFALDRETMDEIFSRFSYKLKNRFGDQIQLPELIIIGTFVEGMFTQKMEVRFGDVRVFALDISSFEGSNIKPEIWVDITERRIPLYDGSHTLPVISLNNMLLTHFKDARQITSGVDNQRRRSKASRGLLQLAERVDVIKLEVIQELGEDGPEDLLAISQGKSRRLVERAPSPEAEQFVLADEAPEELEAEIVGHSKGQNAKPSSPSYEIAQSPASVDSVQKEATNVQQVEQLKEQREQEPLVGGEPSQGVEAFSTADHDPQEPEEPQSEEPQSEEPQSEEPQSEEQQSEEPQSEEPHSEEQLDHPVDQNAESPLPIDERTQSPVSADPLQGQTSSVLQEERLDEQLERLDLSPALPYSKALEVTVQQPQVVEKPTELPVQLPVTPPPPPIDPALLPITEDEMETAGIDLDQLGEDYIFDYKKEKEREQPLPVLPSQLHPSLKNLDTWYPVINWIRSDVNPASDDWYLPGMLPGLQGQLFLWNAFHWGGYKAVDGRVILPRVITSEDAYTRILIARKLGNPIASFLLAATWFRQEVKNPDQAQVLLRQAALQYEPARVALAELLTGDEGDFFDPEGLVALYRGSAAFQDFPLPVHIEPWVLVRPRAIAVHQSLTLLYRSERTPENRRKAAALLLFVLKNEKEGYHPGVLGVMLKADLQVFLPEGWEKQCTAGSARLQWVCSSVTHVPPDEIPDIPAVAADRLLNLALQASDVEAVKAILISHSRYWFQRLQLSGSLTMKITSWGILGITFLMIAGDEIDPELRSFWFSLLEQQLLDSARYKPELTSTALRHNALDTNGRVLIGRLLEAYDKDRGNKQLWAQVMEVREKWPGLTDTYIWETESNSSGSVIRSPGQIGFDFELGAPDFQDEQLLSTLLAGHPGKVRLSEKLLYLALVHARATVKDVSGVKQIIVLREAFTYGLAKKYLLMSANLGNPEARYLLFIAPPSDRLFIRSADLKQAALSLPYARKRATEYLLNIDSTFFDPQAWLTIHKLTAGKALPEEKRVYLISSHPNKQLEVVDRYMQRQVSAQSEKDVQEACAIINNSVFDRQKTNIESYDVLAVLLTGQEGCLPVRAHDRMSGILLNPGTPGNPHKLLKNTPMQLVHFINMVREKQPLKVEHHASLIAGTEVDARNLLEKSEPVVPNPYAILVMARRISIDRKAMDAFARSLSEMYWENDEKKKLSRMLLTLIVHSDVLFMNIEANKRLGLALNRCEPQLGLIVFRYLADWDAAELPAYVLMEVGYQNRLWQSDWLGAMKYRFTPVLIRFLAYSSQDQSLGIKLREYFTIALKRMRMVKNSLIAELVNKAQVAVDPSLEGGSLEEVNLEKLKRRDIIWGELVRELIENTRSLPDFIRGKTSWDDLPDPVQLTIKQLTHYLHPAGLLFSVLMLPAPPRNMPAWEEPLHLLPAATQYLPALLLWEKIRGLKKVGFADLERIRLFRRLHKRVPAIDTQVTTIAQKWVQQYHPVSEQSESLVLSAEMSELGRLNLREFYGPPDSLATPGIPLQSMVFLTFYELYIDARLGQSWALEAKTKSLMSDVVSYYESNGLIEHHLFFDALLNPFKADVNQLNQLGHPEQMMIFASRLLQSDDPTVSLMAANNLVDRATLEYKGASEEELGRYLGWLPLIYQRYSVYPVIARALEEIGMFGAARNLYMVAMANSHVEEDRKGYFDLYRDGALDFLLRYRRLFKGQIPEAVSHYMGVLLYAHILKPENDHDAAAMVELVNMVRRYQKEEPELVEKLLGIITRYGMEMPFSTP